MIRQYTKEEIREAEERGRKMTARAMRAQGAPAKSETTQPLSAKAPAVQASPDTAHASRIVHAAQVARARAEAQPPAAPAVATATLPFSGDDDAAITAICRGMPGMRQPSEGGTSTGGSTIRASSPSGDGLDADVARLTRGMPGMRQAQGAD